MISSKLIKICTDKLFVMQFLCGANNTSLEKHNSLRQILGASAKLEYFITSQQIIFWKYILCQNSKIYIIENAHVIKRQHFAVSLHEAAQVAPTPTISKYFEFGDDKQLHFSLLLSIQGFTEHFWHPGDVNALGRYKQISGRTISGPVCQPGSPTCHQWSHSDCVMLQPCKQQASEGNPSVYCHQATTTGVYLS